MLRLLCLRQRRRHAELCNAARRQRPEVPPGGGVLGQPAESGRSDNRSRFAVDSTVGNAAAQPICVKTDQIQSKLDKKMIDSTLQMMAFVLKWWILY